MSPTSTGHPCILGRVHQHGVPAVDERDWQRCFLTFVVWCTVFVHPCASQEIELPRNTRMGTSAIPKRHIYLPIKEFRSTSTAAESAAALRPSRGVSEGTPPDRGTRPTSHHTRQKRIVLSYELKGCPSTGKGNEEEGQLLQGQEASNQTMRLLRDKLAELLSLKTSNWAEAATSVSEISGYGQATESRRVTTELSSRYLSSLQMEVIKTMPAELSEDEVLRIAEGLPCVEKAYTDGLKYPEEALRGSTERQALQSLQRSGSDAGLDQSHSEYLLWELEHLDDQNWVDSPDDPGFRLQWTLHDSAPFSLHAEKLWHVWTGEKRPMVVAVIDSGCDLEHPDLRSRAWNNPGEICGDGVDNDGNGFVDDCHGWNFAEDLPDVSASANGHGTGAAGILGAAAKNHLGLVGVCWGCEIMCLKFIGKGNGAISDQVQAIDYAVKMGAWISNNSYGGYGFSDLEFDAIRRAQIGGHLFVTSAGNFNLNTDLPQNDHTPSTYKLSNIISVGASTYFGRKAAFSNYGSQTVHVFAPGADVYTTDGVSGYAKVNGTSFASPHVAGAAGLIWSAFPHLTYLQVKEALIEGCTKSGHLEHFAVCGGIIDLLASFHHSAKTATRTSAAFPVPTPGFERPLLELFAPEDEKASQARTLPAKEPELLSVSGTNGEIASAVPKDLQSTTASRQQSTTGLSKEYAEDSSLGPAISFPAYTTDDNANALQNGSFETLTATGLFLSCANELPSTSREHPKTEEICSLLTKFMAVSPSAANNQADIYSAEPITTARSSLRKSFLQHVLQHNGQQTTSSTLEILRNRVSQYLHDKKLKHVEAVNSPSLATPHSLAVDLPSRFLSALHMEVITSMPHGVLPDDVVRLSGGIPCIEKAYRDSAKMIDDTFLNQRPTPSSPNDHGGHVDRTALAGRDRGESPAARHSKEQVPPNDPYFKSQWSLRGDSQYGINAEMAWKVWNGHGRPMIIAVIDSGCDIEHPDLVGNIWKNPGEICGDGIDNDLNGLIDDCHGWDFTRDSPAVEPEKGGHGTSSAGVAAASANNLMATAGVCWGCKVMCLKFFGAEEGLVSNQLQALNYALRNGAWISNNSYGGYGWSELEYEGIRRAQAAGHLFVASAGNHDVETDTSKHFHTPSAYPLSNIISVGASTHKGRKAEFSNYGRSSVHIFAPGTDILATGNGDGIVKVSGTSFAAPHVAGAAGLVWSAFPNLTYAQVKMALLDSCRRVPFLREKASCGGIVDAYKALRLAARVSEGIYAPQDGLNFLRHSSRLSPGSHTEYDAFTPFSVITSDGHNGVGPDEPMLVAKAKPSQSTLNSDPLLMAEGLQHPVLETPFHKKEGEPHLIALSFEEKAPESIPGSNTSSTSELQVVAENQLACSVS